MATQAIKTRSAMFAAVLLLAASGALHAQTWPAKPLRWIIPFAPGGGLDIITRAYSPHLAAALGQAVVPENRPANAGILALEFLAKAPPDGYSLLTSGPGSLMYNKYIYADVKYDAERDFAPITLLTNAPMALYVTASVPAQSLGELLALAKNPGSKLNYGAPGHGHIFHLAMELLKDRTGMDIQFVPYKGSAPMIQDLVAGNIHAGFNPVTSQLLSLAKAGKIRALASGGDSRLRDLPGVPTAMEAGVKDYYAMGGFALYTSGGTPRDIILRINREMVKLATHPEVVKIHDGQNLLVAVGTPEELQARQQKESEIWVPMIKRLGIKAQ
ncbi:MAG: Bug family tripartite tricarboxylate transporter substrate binding protein [Burkholderiales bacterium]